MLQSFLTFKKGENKYEYDPISYHDHYEKGEFVNAIQNDEKQVMIKMFSEKQQQDFNELKRITNQLRQIKSIYFLEMIDAFPFANKVGVVYDYYDLGTFDQFIQSSCLSWRLKIMIDIIQALKCLHENGMIAGDLQPSQIFITSMDTTKESNCKLSVYGRNKPILLNKLKLSEIFRNIVYKAPEVLSNLLTSKMSDIFTFGILMYESITQQLPYISKNGQIMINHFLRITKEVSFHRHEKLSNRMWNTILSCCSFEANERMGIDEITESLLKEKSEVEEYGESFGREYQSYPLQIEHILSQYKYILQEWTEKDSVTIGYKAFSYELTQETIKQKIFEIIHPMIIIQTTEGHIFGCYYDSYIKPYGRRRDINDIQSKENKFFVFILKNPENIQPMIFKKKPQYDVAMRMYGEQKFTSKIQSNTSLSSNTKSKEILTIPNFVTIFKEPNKSYISTNFNVVFDHPLDVSFNSFVEGKSYASPNKVTFDLHSLFILSWNLTKKP